MQTSNELVDALLRRSADGIVSVTPDELSQLLAAAVVERQVETGVAGAIRVLRVGDCQLLQEQTTEGQLLLRAIASRDEADALIADRLEIYERMWDGCGCKVDYLAT